MPDEPYHERWKRMGDYDTWKAVDDYVAEQMIPADPALDAAMAANEAAGLPAIDVSPAQGRLLTLIAKTIDAKAILELGTLGGYSTICLARGLASGGKIVTLELRAEHAKVARANLNNAGVGELVEIHVGPAIDTLEHLKERSAGPFDLVFIDADKQGTPRYFEHALELSRPGTIIIGDNVVRGGTLADPDSEEPGTQGMRSFVELVGADPRVEATVIQTVGVKGYDGFAYLRVTGD